MDGWYVSEFTLNVYSGWETRRKRKGPNDWCILKLGIVGQIVGVDINTEFFRGNCPPFASLEAVSCKDDVTLEELKSMVYEL